MDARDPDLDGQQEPCRVPGFADGRHNLSLDCRQAQEVSEAAFKCLLRPT